MKTLSRIHAFSKTTPGAFLCVGITGSIGWGMMILSILGHPLPNAVLIVLFLFAVAISVNPLERVFKDIERVSVKITIPKSACKSSSAASRRWMRFFECLVWLWLLPIIYPILSAAGY
jgi:hypothetical protein